MLVCVQEHDKSIQIFNLRANAMEIISALLPNKLIQIKGRELCSLEILMKRNRKQKVFFIYATGC